MAKKMLNIKVGYQPYDPVKRRDELKKSTSKATTKKTSSKKKG